MSNSDEFDSTNAVPNRENEKVSEFDLGSPVNSDSHLGAEEPNSGPNALGPYGTATDVNGEQELAERKPKRPSHTKKVLAITGGLAVTIGLLGLGIPAVWLHYNQLPDVSTMAHYAPPESIQIFDRFDKLVAVIADEQDRQVIPLSEVSDPMKKAMLAAEDHDFYSHGGINPSSIMRAFIVNVQAGRIVEGGSTITQQLVKNLFFPGEERSINRKVKEFFTAMQVEKKFPKDRILEMYLNQIYFGEQAYGIERASQRYFDKSSSKLTLAEGAFLAGLVKSPSVLSKPVNRPQAIERQHEVLDKMFAYGLASKADVESAKLQTLHFRKFINPYEKFPFYTSYVMDRLRERFGEEQLQQGMKVYTNLDPVAQRIAERVLDDGIRRAPSGISQGALVSVRVSDGAVLSLVGGVGDFEQHQWNRAVSPHTTGSSFKPFVYLTGFMKGLTPDSIVLDTPITVSSGGRAYSPKNFDHAFMGPMPIRKALALSRNVCAIRVAIFGGINNVIATARAAGITSKLDAYLPTAIGACAVSPLEMAGAYSTFARSGIRITPQVIRKVTTMDDNMLAEYKPERTKVFDTGIVSELRDVMHTAVVSGTAKLANIPGRPVAGKTGTAEHSKDIWFIGFTPDTCTAVWGGNDHNHRVPGKATTGGMVMTRIWKRYMMAYYSAHPTPPGHFFEGPASPRHSVAKLDRAPHFRGKNLLSDDPASDYGKVNLEQWHRIRHAHRSDTGHDVSRSTNDWSPPGSDAERVSSDVAGHDREDASLVESTESQ